MEKTATVFDMGRFRNADGPGIRTIIFFKGCPLRCKWCSNPFGLSPKPQLSVNAERCTGCGRCVEVCPNGVNEMVDGRVKVDYPKCTLCQNCIRACLVPCRSVSGKAYTAKELFEEAYKDIAFYRKNYGGITLSGGEPLMQHEVAEEVLRLCKLNYLNTCMETSGFSTWEALQGVARYCDTVFIDLKHIDSEKHKELTGVPNEIILENMKKLCEWSLEKTFRVIIRIPVIPGCNDNEEALISAAKFIAKLPSNPEVNILPYHNLGTSKYGMVGLDYELKELKMLSHKDNITIRAKEIFEEYTYENRISLGGDAIDLSRP